MVDYRVVPAGSTEESCYPRKRLIEFNHQHVPPALPKKILLNYVIKDNNGKIIAGTESCITCWRVLIIDILWVAQTHRQQGLGGKLLEQLEDDAKKNGCRLVQLDTFDFQAKDYYLKKGYEIFGTLDDNPPGHQRFYFKKNL